MRMLWKSTLFVSVAAAMFSFYTAIVVWSNDVGRGMDGPVIIAFFAYLGITASVVAKLFFRVAFPLSEVEEKKGREEHLSELKALIHSLEMSVAFIAKMLDDAEAVFTSGKIEQTIASIRRNRKQQLLEKNDTKRAELTELLSPPEFEKIVIKSISTLGTIQMAIDAFHDSININEISLGGKLIRGYEKKTEEFQARLKFLRDVSKKYRGLRI